MLTHTIPPWMPEWCRTWSRFFHARRQNAPKCNMNFETFYSKKEYLLGAQPSSRCLWIDGSSSKCWSILTYPKLHESSLDIWKINHFDTLVILFWRHILMVSWKCLILYQIIVICGCIDFFPLFEENGGWSGSRAPKSLRRCCYKWNNVPWLVPSLQRRWFRCWRPSAWRKAKNLRRRWCYLLWAFETERNHRRGTVSNAIDAIEPSTARKTATIRAEAWKSDSTAKKTLGLTLPNPLNPYGISTAVSRHISVYWKEMDVMELLHNN